MHVINQTLYKNRG